MSGGKFDVEVASKWRPAPLCTDPEAVARRAAVDYSQRVSLEDAVSGKAQRQVRIYAPGVFDLFHFGHARQLMQIRSAFKNPNDVYVIVGTPSDNEVLQRKGPSVNNAAERCESLRHCRYVDEVVPIAPFVMNRDFLTENKIDFIAHDDIPYPSPGCDDIFQWLRDAGMFFATERTPGISTTGIISRVISNAEDFVLKKLLRNKAETRKKVNNAMKPRLASYLRRLSAPSADEFRVPSDENLFDHDTFDDEEL